MSSTLIPPCTSPPSPEGGAFSYDAMALALIGAALGPAARSLLNATPVMRSLDEWDCCEFGPRVGPIVFHTAPGFCSLPVVVHEAGHAYHVHLLRGLSLVAPTWRCEAFAYYAVYRAFMVLGGDAPDLYGFDRYLDAHEALHPKATGLARILLHEPPHRAVVFALAGG